MLFSLPFWPSVRSGTACRSNPSNRSLDFPTTAIAAEFSFVLQRRSNAVRSVRTDQVDAVCLQTQSQLIAVSRFVVNQPFQMGPETPPTDAWNADLLHRRLDQLDFVRCRRLDQNAERNSSRLIDEHYIRTHSLFRLADRSPPFLAGEKVPSAKDSFQFNRDTLSSMASKVCHIRIRTPACDHSFICRQQVLPDGKHFGTSLYLAPLRRIHRIPSRQTRFGAGTCLPLEDDVVPAGYPFHG